MTGGRISESGTYAQLLSTNGAFAEFLRTYASEAAAASKDNETESAMGRYIEFCLKMCDFLVCVQTAMSP